MIARRRDKTKPCPPTSIVHLDRHPRNEAEVESLLTAINEQQMGEWGLIFDWPRERIETGDWACVSFRNQGLMEAVDWLYTLPQLMTIGGAGQAEPRRPLANVREAALMDSAQHGQAADRKQYSSYETPPPPPTHTLQQTRRTQNRQSRKGHRSKDMMGANLNGGVFADIGPKAARVSENFVKRSAPQVEEL